MSLKLYIFSPLTTYFMRFESILKSTERLFLIISTVLSSLFHFTSAPSCSDTILIGTNVLLFSMNGLGRPVITCPSIFKFTELLAAYDFGAMHNEKANIMINAIINRHLKILSKFFLLFIFSPFLF